MMLEDDLDYWRARVMQEQEASQVANCPAARHSHDQLAAMYKSKISAVIRPMAGPGVSAATADGRPDRTNYRRAHWP